jgi:hypothetical protein
VSLLLDEVVLFRKIFGSFVAVTNGTACMGVRDLGLMRDMCMIVILEMFCRFVMMPRCLSVMVRC